MLLSGKTAVISGAASPRGIGLATARRFVAEGARVAILDIDGAAAESAARNLNPISGKPHLGLACNVADQDSCVKAVEAVIAAFGQIDILINNAGVTQPVKLLDITASDWDRIQDVNLKGVLFLSQAVIPHMRRRKTGPSPACLPSRHSGAAAFLADRTIPPRRPAFLASQRRWRASSGPIASVSIA